MLIGVDFDNTIVCWDEIFHAAALNRGLIAPNVPHRKEKVRNQLRAEGREETWTELQGAVYGTLTSRAPLFPGVVDFFLACRRQGIRVAIVSHKTRHPVIGPNYDLHGAAQEYLRARGFYASDGMGINAADVYFEITKADKLSRIALLECTHFIDDLPEFLSEPNFPAQVERVLFDPNAYHPESARYRRAASWMEIEQWLTGPS